VGSAAGQDVDVSQELAVVGLGSVAQRQCCAPPCCMNIATSRYDKNAAPAMANSNCARFASLARRTWAGIREAIVDRAGRS
jgi:hypothetical protein